MIRNLIPSDCRPNLRMKAQRIAITLFILLGLLCFPGSKTKAQEDMGSITNFARLALTCLHQEYPNKITHTLADENDIRSPRDLHPAFFGCYDWHSSVHGHWLLVRLLKLYPDYLENKDAVIRALDESFTIENIAAEAGYFDRLDRRSFERPYGYAWFLQLMSELRSWDRSDRFGNEKAVAWLRALQPLEDVIVEKLHNWLPKLAYPIRLGTHNQTAFAFSLMIDWAREKQDETMIALLLERSNSFYLNDTNCPISYEPSGEDFLSPCLMEADLMRRTMNSQQFSIWLETFLPQISSSTSDWLPVAIVNDPTDGKLVHLDGLNLSRAWALNGIAQALPIGDERRAKLEQISRLHASAGLASVTGEHYAGGHWLASFAVYYLTQASTH